MRVAFCLVIAACGRLDFAPISKDCATAPPDQPCFAITIASATWGEAVTACSLLGPTTHLATITNAEDNALAASLAATIPFTPSQTTNQRQRMWLGGTDQAMTGTWRWLDGTPFSFTSWRAGEPGTPGTEHCLILLGSEHGLWDNRPCGLAYDAYLCERD